MQRKGFGRAKLECSQLQGTPNPKGRAAVHTAGRACSRSLPSIQLHTFTTHLAPPRWAQSRDATPVTGQAQPAAARQPAVWPLSTGQKCLDVKTLRPRGHSPPAGAATAAGATGGSPTAPASRSASSMSASSAPGGPKRLRPTGRPSTRARGMLTCRAARRRRGGEGWGAGCGVLGGCWGGRGRASEAPQYGSAAPLAEVLHSGAAATADKQTAPWRRRRRAPSHLRQPRQPRDARQAQQPRPPVLQRRAGRADWDRGPRRRGQREDAV
jgi:hypothetical protein